MLTKSKLIGLTFFIHFVSITVQGQNINQFDLNEKRHGIWQKTFKDTHVLRYEGTFIHGKETGLFKFYKNINNKAVLSATKLFDDTSGTAQVIFLDTNGKPISEGKMLGKLYIGTWKFYHKNSKNLLILEHYNESGQLHGERYVYYKNGQIAEKQHYQNGKLEGTSFWYSERQIVLKAYNYVNGELHGVSKFYNPKGELLAEGLYKRGKKDGIWRYYENDSLVKQKDFTYKSKYIKKNKN